MFSFSKLIMQLTLETTLTKRTLLSQIAKTFDPPGWLSPVIIQFKLIMQIIWKYELQWDEIIPSDIAIVWKQLTENLLFVKDYQNSIIFIDKFKWSISITWFLSQFRKGICSSDLLSLNIRQWSNQCKIRNS